MSRLFSALCLGLLLAGCDIGSPYNINESKAHVPSTYFRLAASYKVRKTGEIVEFDYVAVCGGSVTSWTHTSPSVWVTVTPGIMLAPTSTGQAIGVRTPELCGQRYSKRNPDYPIPDDFLPHTIWYPDLEKMSFGFAYASDLAYESPYSRLEFLGAKLELSDASAWQAWRDKSAAEYQQIGGMPGPWGYSGQYESRETGIAVAKLNGGRGIAYDFCTSVARLELPDAVRDDALALIPESAGRYWTPQYWMEEEDELSLYAILGHDRARIYNGGMLAQHKHDGRGGGGVRRSTGKIVSNSLGTKTWTEGGALNVTDGSRNYYHDLFPVLYNQPAEVDPQTGDTNRFETVVLHQPEWNGFQFCGLGAINPDGLQAYANGTSDELSVDHRFSVGAVTLMDRSPDHEGWRGRLLVNDEEIARADHLPWIGKFSNTILDRHGYVLLSCCIEVLGRN